MTGTERGPIRVVIADDHPLIRGGLKSLLAGIEDIEVVGEAADGREALARAQAGGLDLLVLDLTMPHGGGVDLVRRLHLKHPDLAILVHTMHDDAAMASQVLRAGAAGFATKGMDPDELIAAIRKVGRGGRYLMPDMADRLLHDVAGVGARQPHDRLSERERQVLELLLRGVSVNDIAQHLHLSPKTVSTHKARLMEKLGVASVPDLVRYALAHGLTELSSDP